MNELINEREYAMHNRILKLENMIEVEMREKEINLLNEKYELEYRYHGLNEREDAIHNRILEIENYLDGAFRDELNALYDEKYELEYKLFNSNN